MTKRDDDGDRRRALTELDSTLLVESTVKNADFKPERIEVGP